jgi:hypothetical protein
MVIPDFINGTHARGTSSGGFSLLTCEEFDRNREPHYCAKRWNWNGSKWEKAAKKQWPLFYLVNEVSCDSLDELAAWFVKASANPRNTIIRAPLTPAARAENQLSQWMYFQRICKPSSKRPYYVPPFMAVSHRRWLMVDIEKFLMRATDDINRDPVRAIKWAIRELLPAAFQNVRCFYLFSGSAGIDPRELRVHLLFWLDRPIDDEALHRTMEQIAPSSCVDKSVCRVTQPHFIANPIITGAPDPVSQRTGWIGGTSQEVVLPILAPVDAPSKRKRSRSFGGAGGEQSRAAGKRGRSRYNSLQDALAHLGDGDRLDGFNDPLLLATWHYALECQRGARPRDDEGFVSLLLEFVRAAPRRAGRDPLEYVNDCTYLYDLIDGAFAKLDQRTGDAETRPAPVRPVGDTKTARIFLGNTVQGAVQAAAEAWRKKVGGDTAIVMPHVGISAETGLGKTEELIKAAGWWIPYMRAAVLPHRILYFVPHHKLSAELRERFTDFGIRAAVYKGRLYKDPITKEYTHCLEPEKVEYVRRLLLTAEIYACGTNADPDKRCPRTVPVDFSSRKSMRGTLMW